MTKDGQSDKSRCVRERIISERALKRWSITARNLAAIFNELPDRTISLDQIYDWVRTWHLNEKIEKYSESAIRASLSRFCRDSLLLVKRRKLGRKISSDYTTTPLGREVFAEALRFFASWDPTRPLIHGEQWGVHKVTIPEPTSRDMVVQLRSWREVLAMDSGWSENTRITKIRLDPFIIKNLRSATGEVPKGGNKAEWLSVRGQEFVMQVSKNTTIQLWIRGAGWRKDLAEWLQQVPNLEERHMDQIWNRIRDRLSQTTTTREYHVSEPKMTEGNVHLFRQGNPLRRLPGLRPPEQQVSRRDGGPYLWSSGQRGRRMHAPGCRVRSRLNLLPPHEGNVGGRPGQHEAATGSGSAGYEDRGRHTAPRNETSPRRTTRGQGLTCPAPTETAAAAGGTEA